MAVEVNGEPIEMAISREVGRHVSALEALLDRAHNKDTKRLIRLQIRGAIKRAHDIAESEQESGGRLVAPTQQ